MNPHKISPDDPRLTAYALNEMEPAERTEFEQALAQDAAARQTVAEIRATVASLTTALADEPLPVAAKPDLAQAAIVPGHDPRKLDGGPARTKGWLNKPIKFPQFYYIVSGFAAACFAVVFLIHQREEANKVHTRLIEVPLTASVEVKDEGKAKTHTESVAVDLPVAPVVALEEEKKETVSPSLVASSAPASPAAVSSAPAVPTLESEVITLSPFTVEAAPTAGYTAQSTLAGTRVSTELKDIGSISVTTQESMSAAGKSNKQDLLRYTTGTELAGQGKKVTWGSGRVRQEHNTEAYGFRRDNDYVRVADQPLSTFSADVDTASYANVRRFLTQGQRPPADAVRIEELVNYFPYDYAGPGPMESRSSAVAKAADKEGTPSTNKEISPFAAHLEVASAPWAPEHRLVRIGLKGREVSEAARPAANLVFLLDVSGSMNEPNKLPLVKQSLRMLVEKLRPDDRVAIAVYAGASGLALPSTSARHKAEILDAIDRLQAEGSTNGARGIQLAYDIAKANFIPGGVNRVILATDGDFNVGVTSEGELVRLVEAKAKSGVALTVLGFGMGNLKDSTLESLADKGDGNYAYIDTLAEAKKSLVEQAGGTLVTIAKDVKLQVEFNPALVQAYRLIGYENRLLAKEDFNNDKVDAGEVGAGHTVTALYEIVPVGVALPSGGTDDALKYQVTETSKTKHPTPNSNEMLTVKIRYKDPAGSRLAAKRLTPSENYTDAAPEMSRKLEFSLRDTGTSFAEASPDFQFAAAVAAFGMVLRDSPHKGAMTLADVAAWGRASLGRDPGGYRNEFIGLVDRARQILQ